MPEEKIILRKLTCPHCKGTGVDSVSWIPTKEHGLVPAEKRCPFCNDGYIYEEEVTSGERNRNWRPGTNSPK